MTSVKQSFDLQGRMGCVTSANITGVRLAVGKGSSRLVILQFNSLGKLFQPLWGKKDKFIQKNTSNL